MQLFNHRMTLDLMTGIVNNTVQSKRETDNTLHTSETGCGSSAGGAAAAPAGQAGEGEWPTQRWGPGRHRPTM